MENLNISLFAYPTKSQLFIKGLPIGLEHQIKIYDEFGKLIQQVRLYSRSSLHLINIGLRKGAYNVQVSNSHIEQTLCMYIDNVSSRAVGVRA